MAPVPFNRPPSLESAYEYLRRAVDNMHLSGDGPFTKRCSALLEELIGAPVALLSTSPEREDTILVRDPFAD